MAIFEIAAKRWLMRSTTVNGFEFQSYTDCLKVFTQAAAGPVCRSALLFTSWKSFLHCRKMHCGSCGGASCSEQRGDCLCVIWGRRRDGSEKRPKAQAVRDIWSVSAGRDAEPWHWSAEVMRIGYEWPMRREWAENTVFIGYSQHYPCSVNILIEQVVPVEGRMKQEVMSPFLLRAALQGRAGTLTPAESKPDFLRLTSQYTWRHKVSQGCPGARGRWEQRAEPHVHVSNASRAPQDSPLQSCRERFHGKGSQLQPRGTEALFILILNCLPSLLTFCQSCFQGKLSHSLLCSQAGLVWNHKTPSKPTAQVWFFCLGFWEFKKVFCGSAAESALVGWDFWMWFLWSNFAKSFAV